MLMNLWDFAVRELLKPLNRAIELEAWWHTFKTYMESDKMPPEIVMTDKDGKETVVNKFENGFWST